MVELMGVPRAPLLLPFSGASVTSVFGDGVKAVSQAPFTYKTFALGVMLGAVIASRRLPALRASTVELLRRLALRRILVK